MLHLSFVFKKVNGIVQHTNVNLKIRCYEINGWFVTGFHLNLYKKFEYLVNFFISNAL